MQTKHGKISQTKRSTKRLSRLLFFDLVPKLQTLVSKEQTNALETERLEFILTQECMLRMLYIYI